MDRKTFAFKLTNLDFAGRTVEGYANVFGVKDLVGDIVHPGAFSKTLVERGGKVKFLWQHDPGEPLGRMLEMQEDQHGLFFKAIISDTARGRDALSLLRDGAVDSFSIGYDAVKGGTDYTKDPASGDTIRNLRELKLYEVSLVTLPANEMATVTALKDQGPSEGKPYGVFMNGGQHCVYKVDEEGNRTGEIMGCHDSEGEAMAQMRAIMANEKGDATDTQDEKAQSLSDVVDDVYRAFRGQFPDVEEMIRPSVNEFYVHEVFPSYVIVCSYGESEYRYYSVSYTLGMDGEITFSQPSEWIGGDYVFTPGVKSEIKPLDTKAGRVIARRNADRIMNVMNLLHELLMDAGLMEDEEDDEDKSTTAPEEAADNKPESDKQAGPVTAPPTSEDLLRLIEISQKEIEMTEV